MIYIHKINKRGKDQVPVISVGQFPPMNEDVHGGDESIDFVVFECPVQIDYAIDFGWNLNLHTVRLVAN